MDGRGVTAIVLTHDEAPNIGRTLEQLRWCAEVLVVDSGSNDGTLEIVRGFANVRVLERAFDSFDAQRNFAIDHAGSAWLLLLDADYWLTPALVDEIAALVPAPEVVGYRVHFRYCVEGRPLRGSLYPDRVALFRRGAGRYVRDGHAEQLQITGPIGRLKHPVWHDDRKSLARWLAAQDRYAQAEVRKLLDTPQASLNRADRIRSWIWLAPILVFFYTLLIKRTLFDGWRGWLYTWQRVLAEVLLAIRLVEARLRTQRDSPVDQ